MPLRATSGGTCRIFLVTINGSERIANVPELSSTLKICARLRKQFLPYFTDGVLIGNCLLREIRPGVRVSAYVLTGRVLAVVLNQSPAGTLAFSYNLEACSTIPAKSISHSRWLALLAYGLL